MSFLTRWNAKLQHAQANRKHYLAKAGHAHKHAGYIRNLIAKRKKANAAKVDRPSLAVKYALSFQGVKESPANSNRGKLIDGWQKGVGMIAQPWCGAFVHGVLSHVGVKGLSARMRYTPYIVEDGRAGKNGLLCEVGWDDKKRGDLFLFDFDGGGVDHVGIFTGITYADGSAQTVEGNTSSGSAGSQSNGGMVAVRSRPRSIVAHVIRPRY